MHSPGRGPPGVVLHNPSRRKPQPWRNSRRYLVAKLDKEKVGGIVPGVKGIIW